VESPGLTLRLTCRLDAPRERVFRALTDASELARWFGPRGGTLPELSLELRVCGRYRFTMKPPGCERFHLSGEFLEVEFPHRLVYTFRYEEPAPDDRETVVVLALAALGQTTEIFLLQDPFATAERLALHRTGWTESFEKLRELVERESPLGVSSW
jgi:uncharacterized protein YndB with AHSA1/START domain